MTLVSAAAATPVAPSERSLVLHAHLYQPPREDPHTGEVEAEPSAAPSHDWNQRIEHECYRALVASRVTAPDGRILRLSNTLEWISFNIGPTLFEWLERHAADTYERMLAADAASCARLNGHGNAIAQPYHHTILPLASRRDKTTEVKWGLADFRRRYGREAEGMWLPETAVDDATLDVLAEQGVKFTIVAPHQVDPLPLNGAPGVYVTSGGHEIALFPYHGDLSHSIAFGTLTRDARTWMDAMARIAETMPKENTQLVSAATDGETYGHHQRFADMALAHVLELAAAAGFVVENFASFLARYPATTPVELVEPTSWSCAHGVERWQSNCGCRMDMSLPPRQEWRAPLRKALHETGDAIHVVFEQEGGALFDDPWKVRDEYGAVVMAADERRDEFFRRWLKPGSTSAERARAAELLEMERDALRMFTSCAWFFDDVGIEARQVLRYARRAIDLAGGAGGASAVVPAKAFSAARAHSDGRTAMELLLQLPSLREVETQVAAAAFVLKQFGADVEEHLPIEFDAVTDRSTVTLVARRTNRTTRYSVELIDVESANLACRLRPLDLTTEPDTHVVALHSFPEIARLEIRRRLRNALLPQCLSSHELQSLARGEATIRELLVPALRRSLSEADGVRGVALSQNLLDLHDQLEVEVPFDAVTAFWDTWTRAEVRTSELTALGRRLGFYLP